MPEHPSKTPAGQFETIKSNETREGSILYGDAYFQYLHQRGGFRRFIRRIYLRDITSYCIGRTIDFGCGSGELLALLPKGSVGFEINPVAVDHGQKSGLEVHLYDPEVDMYRLDTTPPGVFGSFTMNHVLEHLPDPADTLQRLFASCNRLGIRRIVLTVPGEKGYASDSTHLTFVDEFYLARHGLFDHPAYRLVMVKRFPVNWRTFGQWFTHNELRLVFDAR